nr:PREDICTED: galectin-2-like [Paralichthys olivaceus]
MSLQLELKNVNLQTGDQLKIKGIILHDADRFQIDLGSDEENLALHFNPRFHDDSDGSVLVCNSKSDGCWGDEQRDLHNPWQRGAEIKIVLKLAGDMFEVELADGNEVQFPNRVGMGVFNFIRVTGDIKLMCLKLSQ